MIETTKYSHGWSEYLPNNFKMVDGRNLELEYRAVYGRASVEIVHGTRSKSRESLSQSQAE